VSGYIGGEAIGAVIQILIADKLGRLRFMEFASVLVTIGCIIQTAAQNVGMFIGGRVIAGVAVGYAVDTLICGIANIHFSAMSGTVPVYLSEISSPMTRGLIGGLGGVGLSLGAMTANWVGFACGYVPYGEAQWRVPLALQIPWGIILFSGLGLEIPLSLIQARELTRVQ
jgi:MFS family permease